MDIYNLLIFLIIALLITCVYLSQIYPHNEENFTTTNSGNLTINFKQANNIIGNFRAETVGPINNTNYIPSNFNYSNSQITLKVSGITKDKSGNDVLLSGRAISNDAYQYGVFVIDAVVPKCNNVFPAIWLTAIRKGISPTLNCYVEIDIMETQNDQDGASANIISVKPGGPDGCQKKSTMYDFNTQKSFQDNSYCVQPISCKNAPTQWSQHTFVLAWLQDSITMYVDPSIKVNGNTITLQPNTQPTYTCKDTNKTFIQYTPNPSSNSNNDSYKVWQWDPASFKQPLNIVFNIAHDGKMNSAGRMNPNIVGSQMKISKVMWYSV